MASLFFPMHFPYLEIWQNYCPYLPIPFPHMGQIWPNLFHTFSLVRDMAKVITSSMLTPKVKRAPSNNGVPLISLSLLVLSNSISLLSEASESFSTPQMSPKHSSSSAAEVIAGLMSNKAGSFHGLTSSAMLAVSVFVGFRILLSSVLYSSL